MSPARAAALPAGIAEVIAFVNRVGARVQG